MKQRGSVPDISIPHSPNKSWLHYAVGLCGLFVACVLFSGGALAQAAESDQSANSGSPLMMLGAGDSVSITVYGRPELSTTTYIADNGTVPLPLAGNVLVRGMSPAKAGQAIAAEYSERQLLNDPQVTVLLLESRSQMVSILGNVSTPGRFPIDSNASVLDVLAQAGGISEGGGDLVVVLREDEAGDQIKHRVDLGGLGSDGFEAATFRLHGGDKLMVPPAEQFSVYGEVNTPGVHQIKSDMTVVEAITLSGGITPKGSQNRIEVRRANSDGSYSTKSVSLDDRVQPDDVIRVKRRFF